MDKHLHIISLTVPYPVDYGGVFDIFNKIVSLHEAGIKIHLHCFSNDGIKHPMLSFFCEEIFYYPRRRGLKGFSLRLPYIVSSRSDEKLLSRLNKDDHHILIEGIHCSALLLDKRFDKRKIFLRLHNVEHLYYKKLFLASSSFFKKIYYLFESRLLKKYEIRVAGKASMIFAVSESDAQFYKNNLEITNIRFLPVFAGFQQVSSEKGTGNFCLYHGNLSIPENEMAARWLLNKVFDHLDIPMVIAGKNPSQQLMHAAEKNKNVTVISNPSERDLQHLITHAQVHVLPSFNNTGVKLKLINALFNGRHCVVNTVSARGSGLEELCIIEDDEEKFSLAVAEAFKTPFTAGDIQKRNDSLTDMFNAKINCSRLIHWIW